MEESRLTARKVEESRLASKKIQDGFDGDMPSDIEMKQELEGDNSALLLLKNE